LLLLFAVHRCKRWTTFHLLFIYSTFSGQRGLDKKLIKRIEDIEALPSEEKDKVYYFIDMALSHHKAKKAFAK
jgi:hypothetical protein